MRWNALAAALSLLAVTTGQVTAVGTGQPIALTQVEFEVASVKPNTSGDFRRGMGPAPGGRFTADNVPLRELIAFAYGVSNSRANLQVIGGPVWIDTARFDVQAVVKGGSLPPGEAGTMLRALLIERFKLVAHRESREMPIFLLVMDRQDQQLGPRMRSSAIDCEARRAARSRGGAPPVSTGPPQDPATIRPTCGLRLAAGSFAGDAVTVAQLVEGLAPFVGRIVLDRSGLVGYFNVDLEWTPDPVASSLFTALREQLGVKMESGRGPVDVVVIDSIDSLTPN